MYDDVDGGAVDAAGAIVRPRLAPAHDGSKRTPLLRRRVLEFDFDATAADANAPMCAVSVMEKVGYGVIARGEGDSVGGAHNTRRGVWRDLFSLHLAFALVGFGFTRRRHFTLARLSINYVKMCALRLMMVFVTPFVVICVVCLAFRR